MWTNILLGFIIFLLVIIFGGITNIDRNMKLMNIWNVMNPKEGKVKNDKS